MTEEEMLDELKKTRPSNQFLGCAMLLLGGVILLKETGRSPSFPSVSQEANPEIVTNVTSGSELDHIKDRANKRGYYYRGEFADIMGISERTLDRRIEDGRLDPAPKEDGEGRISIPLDTIIR